MVGKKKLLPLTNALVNITYPDRGEGDSTSTTIVTHATSTAVDLQRDMKEAWSRQEEEEWESDDVLIDKPRTLGYEFVSPEVVWVNLED